MYIYACLVLHSCFTSLDICNCCNPAFLECIHLYLCFTRTSLVLFLLCVCVCGLTGLVECVEDSEGLKRAGGWEHGVLKEWAAGEAPLHHPPHVSLLMHLAAAQAPTRLRQERLRVSPVAQVRDACHIYMHRYTLSDSCLTASLYIICILNIVMIYMYTFI